MIKNHVHIYLMQVLGANSSLLSRHSACFCAPLVHEECELRTGIIHNFGSHLNKLRIESTGVNLVTYNNGCIENLYLFLITSGVDVFRKKRLDELCVERFQQYSKTFIQSWILQGR